MSRSINNSKLLSYANSYEEVSLVKTAVIRKLPNGKWTVKSLKGKNLGEYDTKEEAVKRLRQIEFWKAHPKKTRKKAEKKQSVSYSSVMRELNKNEDEETIRKFQKAFKELFDAALLSGNNDPEEGCLEKALQTIDKSDKKNIEKAAEAIAMGDPKFAGKYLADLIKWMMQRISAERRPKSIENMKKKIYYLNEYQISAKKLPASSSMGQAITLLKHLLLNHSPQYIREVLNNVVRFL
jgi:hypothetical protein